MSDKLAGGILAGATSLSLPVVLRKTTDNTEQTGKVAADMTLSYLRQGGVRVAITASDLAAVNSAYSSGGVKEYDSTNMPGLYRLDPPDAAIATGADWVVFAVKVGSTYLFYERFALTTNVVQTGDNFARLGAPAGASQAADIAAIKAALPTALAADGSIKASIQSILGTAFTEGAAGRIAAAFKQFFNIATPASTMDALTLVTTATNVTTVNGLAASTITAASIASDAITAAKIADNAIDSATFAAGAINAAAIGNDAITAAKIADGAIDANTFAAGAINAAAIAADAITAAKIADGAIDAATFSAGAIDAAAIAPNAIGASELATDAVTEIAAGIRTELAVELARIDATITSRAVAGDAMALTSGERTTLAAVIWNALTSGLTTSGSIGKWILDKLDVVVSTRMATFVYTAPLDAAATRAALGLAAANLDTQLAALTPLSAAAVRAALGMASANMDTQLSGISTKTTNIPAAPAAVSDVPTAAANASAVRTELTTELARIDVATSTRLASGSYTAPDNTGIGVAAAAAASAATNATTLVSRLTSGRATNLDNLDAAVSTRLASAGYTVPPTAAAVAAAVWASVVESTYTATQWLRLIGAACFGKASGLDTGLPKYRDTGDTKDRISATTDADGNRSAVTLDAS